MEDKIMPPEQFIGSAYHKENLVEAPKSLDRALHIFQNSEKAEELLGKDIRDHYHNLMSIERNMYNKVITDWEYKRYFD